MGDIIRSSIEGIFIGALLWAVIFVNVHIRRYHEYKRISRSVIPCRIES